MTTWCDVSSFILRPVSRSVLPNVFLLFFLLATCRCYCQTGCPAYSSLQVATLDNGSIVTTTDDGIMRDNGASVTVNLYSAPAGTSCGDDNCTSYQFDSTDAQAGGWPRSH